MDTQGLVFIVLLASVFLLMLLTVVLKPWKLRSDTRKKLKTEINTKRVEAEVAEQLAAKYQKKGRL